ncbi:MAG: hypothetical protein HY717_01465 [Planctomycetes bacterium]|nr:hypothetical protein [Planctomycetota bacterium]
MASGGPYRLAGELVRELGRLLETWWRADRVRASPAEGRLLRIAPPALLRVRGEPAEVRRRLAGASSAGPFVIYLCQNARGPCELRVRPVGPDYRPTLLWVEAGKETGLDESEVEVW